MSDKPIIIQSRLHEGDQTVSVDLTGAKLEHLNIPMDFDPNLIIATERMICGKELGGAYAAFCICPACIGTNKAMQGIFGSIPEPEKK